MDQVLMAFASIACCGFPLPRQCSSLPVWFEGAGCQVQGDNGVMLASLSLAEDRPLPREYCRKGLGYVTSIPFTVYPNHSDRASCTGTGEIPEVWVPAES